MTAAERPSWFGLSFTYRIEGYTRWLQLCAVAPNGPAARAGLQKGDQITHIDQKPIAFASDRAVLQFLARSRRITFRVARGTRAFDVTVTGLPMTDIQLRTYERNLSVAH
ncbi:MAG: PDZ domain-containing protein [Thermoanaerobaculia bacterium]